MVKPAPGGQLTPWKLVAPSTTSASSTSRCAPPFPCTPIPPLHACSMLTCLPLCHRSLLGRIFESKNISHIGVDSARRACHLRRGRARAREAVARGLGRSVLCRVLCYPRPARKPPVHGICCRTFVSCRVPFSGIYIYIVYKCVCPWLSADHSRETSENGISIPSTRGMPMRHGRRRRGQMRSALVTLSAHRFGSWTRRTPTHRMVSGQLSKAQTRPSRPQTRESRADESSRRACAESVVEGAVEGSARIWSAGTGTFEHWEADPAPCGARAVAQSTWSDAQPTRLSKNRCPAHSLGRAEVIWASTCRTLSTRQVGRHGDF
jgi:hypothetical protein